MPFGALIIAVTLVLLLAEIATGRHRNIYHSNEKKVLAASIIAGALIARPLASLGLAALMHLVAPTWSGTLSAVPFIPAYLACLFVAEFCFYWVHRLAHESAKWKNPWLWRMHRTHHSAKYMNVILNYRLNFFWYFISPPSWIFAITIYLGQEAAAALALFTIAGWNLITHSNFRWDEWLRNFSFMRPVMIILGHLIIMPSVHHSHHGYGKNGGPFRNYAITLALYDWMFGTLFIPDGRPWRYGTPGTDPHWTEEVWYPLIRRSRSSS